MSTLCSCGSNEGPPFVTVPINRHDLSNDIGEQHDLSNEKPDVLESVRSIEKAHGQG